MRKGISWNHHQCSVLLEKETENMQILQAKVGRKLIFFQKIKIYTSAKWFSSNQTARE